MKILSTIAGRSNLQLVAILIIGFWFRIQGFLYGTFAFTYDVGRDFLAVSQMISSHKPLLIGATTGLQGIFYGPTWYYMMTPFYLISGGNPSGVAFFMAITGILTAYLGYVLGSRVGGFFLGLTIALFISLSQVLTEISVQIWNPNPIPLFVMLAFVILHMALSKSKEKRLPFFILGLTLGMIFDLELVFGVLFTLSTLLYLAISGFLHKNIRYLSYMILGFILIQLPRIIFEFRHDFLMTRTLINSLRSEDGEGLLLYVPKFVQTLQKFFEVWKDTVAWQNPITGIGILFLVGLVIVVTYRKLEFGEKKLIEYVFSVLFVFIVGLSFFNHDIESHYYIGIPVIYTLILAFSVYLARKYLKVKFIIIISAIVILSILLNQLKLLGTFAKSTWVGDASVYRNQVEVVDYIYQDAKNQKFNTITYTPPVHDYPYQYLFQWHGKKTYGYTPSKEYQKLFYLIIEPDLQFPVRQKEWLEVRKEDGEILVEKKFESGIKVQKRLH